MTSLVALQFQRGPVFPGARVASAAKCRSVRALRSAASGR